MMRTLGPQALPAPPRAQRLIGLLLALLAQTLWLPLLLRTPPMALPAKIAGLLELRLIEPLRPSSPPTAPRSPSLRLSARGAPADSPANAPTLAPPTAQTPTSPEPIQAAAVPPASPAVAAAPAPLRLSLPAARPASGARPDSLLGQVLNDPRANSERRGLAFAVADAAGTLPVVSQSSTDGTESRLIRQGSHCLRVKEFRGKIIDPMNADLRGAASIVGHCVND